MFLALWLEPLTNQPSLVTGLGEGERVSDLPPAPQKKAGAQSCIPEGRLCFPAVRATGIESS